MITITSHDIALGLVYGEFEGMTPAEIRINGLWKYTNGEITMEVYDNICDIIRRRGVN